MGQVGSTSTSSSRKRRVAVRFIVVALAAAIASAALIGTGVLNITSSARPAGCYREEVPIYTSPHDRDGDGLDDQADILAGALNYVATRPRYRSAYCPSGYPDDGYGVCADVVAFALRDAGYDLQSLVAVDVAASPGAYGIEDPDSAIDFRRVRNLRVYCERHAQSLTCDTDDIEAWHGGDIVVYDGHIGIVSDRRDARGMSFLIHHASPFQLAYEEDRLDSYGTIIGRYRM